MIHQPFIKKMLPADAPSLIDSAEDDFIAEFFVLREVRYIARELEANRRVTGSRVPRLLKEVVETIRLYASDREKRRDVFHTIGNPRKALVPINIYIQKARQQVIHDSSACFISMKLSECIHHRTSHFYTPVPRAEILSVLQNEGNESTGKHSRKTSNAFLLN